MTMQAPAQFYTADDISAAVAADFSSHGIAASVEVNEWAPEKHPGEPRVIIDFGDGTIGEPSGHYQPGLQWTVPGTTDVARALLDDAQGFILWIHAPGVGSSEGAAAAARRATDQLMRQTMRAIRRALSAPFVQQARVRWPAAPATDEGSYPAWVKGSLARVEIVLTSPILDDAFTVINVTEAGTATSFAFPDGSTTPPEAS